MSRSAPIIVAALAVLLVPILHFLSLAPAHDLADRELISGDAFDAFAAPFRWLADRWPPMHDWFGVYWDWWRDNSPTQW